MSEVVGVYETAGSQRRRYSFPGVGPDSFAHTFLSHALPTVSRQAAARPSSPQVSDFGRRGASASTWGEPGTIRKGQTMKNRIQLVLAVGVMVGACPAIAPGAVVSFESSIEFSGAAPPAGAAPWLSATFDDGGSAGSVTLTLTAVNLTGTEFVTDWLFNLDPNLDPTELTFSLSGDPNTRGFSDPNIRTETDKYKPDGDGKFDIEIAFAPSGGPGVQFDAGDVAVFTVGGISSLTAGSFDHLSAPAPGGHGPFPTAAHVQGIGDDSGWVTVPEPAALLLLGAAGPILQKRKSRRS